MFGWRKRSEGFEWEKYVRTTIKVRRADRRERAVGFVRRLRDRASGFLRACGARARSGFAAFRRGIARAFGAMAGRIAMAGREACRGLTTRLTGRLRPALAALDSAGLTGLLALAGGIVLALFATRVWNAPIDAIDAVGAALAGGGSLLLALALAAGLAAGRFVRPARLQAFFALLPRRIPASLPGLSRLPSNARGLVVAGVVVAVGLGAAHWIGSGRTPGTGLLDLVTGSAPSFGARSTLRGRASAITGDTLRVSDRTVRLEGLEAPDLGQRCAGTGGKNWRCGAAARDALAKLVAGKTVTCRVAANLAAGRSTEGLCAVADGRGAEVDVGAVLVRDGHVFAEKGFRARYASEVAEARSEARGLWQNRDDGERPAQWRQRVWREAARKAPDGCPIKGRVSSAGKHYVLPWQAPYPKTRVQEKRGGRWFCSEEDARTAGFRPELGT